MKYETLKLFVYGTLLKGERNSHHLLDCELVRATSVPGRLYKTAFGFPAAVFDPDSEHRIYGELYRIPKDRTEIIIENLDILEGVSDNLFKRTLINYGKEEFYFYGPGEKLENDIKAENSIDNGRWRSAGGLALSDTVQFARNFELYHKKYYREPPDNRSDETIFLKGSRKILITCPHSTVHRRKDRKKIMELYTAAIGTALHSMLDCFCLYTNRSQESDPNYYDDNPFKSEIGKIAAEENIEFVLDLHGTGSRRKYDVYPGIGKEREFLLGKKQILEDLYSKADINGITVGSLNTFPAVRQMTVTKFAAREIGIPAMQLEINRRMRLPSDNGNLARLVEFINGFLKDI